MWPRVCLVSVQLLALLTIVASQCSVNIRDHIPTKDPVYLTSTGALWAPKGPALTWAAGEQSVIACTGTSNYLTLNSQQTNTITCSSATTFTVAGGSHSTSNLQCNSQITGDYLATGTSCGNGYGSLINLGFSTTLGFTTYIASCYDMVTGSVRYTKHPLPGAAIDYTVIETSRPSFKSSGTASHVNPATSYTQASQKTRLTELLGSATLADQYLSSTSFLARGHLAPDGDGIFRSWSFTTYFYTNVAPEWQVVNAGNWLRVENAARSKASKLGVDLEIYTGTYDVMTLPDVNNNQVKITLEAGGNIEVPKWFWKIIRNPSTNQGIALVTLNNPFVTSTDTICRDICSSSGWFQDAYNNYEKGYTYCCAVSDLMSAVPFIPSEANVSAVLNY